MSLPDAATLQAIIDLVLEWDRTYGRPITVAELLAVLTGAAGAPPSSR